MKDVFFIDSDFQIQKVHRLENGSLQFDNSQPFTLPEELLHDSEESANKELLDILHKEYEKYQSKAREILNLINKLN